MKVIEQFIQFLLSQKKPVSRITAKNYKADLRHFILWFEKEFNNPFTPVQVTPQIIEIYKNTKSVSPRSMDRHLSTLRKFFSFTKESNILSENPFKQLSTFNFQLSTPSDPWKLKDFKNYLYVYNASNLTIKNYISDIEKFLDWLEKVTGIENAWNIKEKNLFEKIGTAALLEYKNRLLKTGFSPKSINRKLSSLRKYITWLEKEGHITKKSAFADYCGLTRFVDNHEPDLRTTSTLSEKQLNGPYSKFPPLRVVQKLSQAGLFFFDTVITEPLAKVLSNAKNGLLDIKQKPLFSSKHNIRNLKLEIRNYQKSLYAPLSVSTASFPIHKKIYHYMAHSRPQWYEKYHSYTITHYLHLAVLVLFTSICGFLITQTITKDQNNQAILGTNIDATTTKTLAFQGKLFDTNRIPITQKTAVKFVLYDDTTTRSPLWEETQDITPHSDGTFSVTLGTVAPIAKRIISDNSSLYLGITVNNQPELFPREQIATASNAANAETLDGLPVITQSNAGTKNVVLALDSSGNLTIGNNASPVFQATGGNFTLLGQSMLFTTSPGSNGNIQISPDGTGTVDIQKPIQNTSNNSSANGVQGAVEIADLLSIVATSSSQSAFTINQNSVGPIISASTSGTAKFTLENDGTTYIAGNIGIGTPNPLAKLQVAGNISPSDTNSYDLGSPSLRFNTLYINSIVASSSGTLGYWQRKEGTMTPTTITDALNLGATATSSATVHLAATSNENSFIKSGNVGVGTASPNARLHIQGTATQSAAITISDSDGVRRLTILDNGNIGIGTSSPDYKLDVVGSINATNDIYKNGTAFNNPDYVFEKWSTGDIVKFANNKGASQYKGMLSLEDTETFVRQTLQLPNVASASGIFERGDILLEKVEEAYIHLFNLNSKISSLIETFTTKKLISPIAQIDRVRTNVISPLSSDSVVVDGKLVIRHSGLSSSWPSPGSDSGEVVASQNDVVFEVQNASGSAVATIDNEGNASFSGVLRARKIIVDEIDNATASASFFNSQLSTLNSLDIASYSGQLSLDTLNASFGNFVQGLVAIGPTSLTDTTISGNLNIGKHLVIADESINVIGADINLQPLRQGGVSLLSGLVYIDTEGNLSVVNNATFGKDVSVYGKLSAGVISPLPDQNLVIQNASGSAVLSINSIGDLIASGSATIKKLNLDVIPEAIAISDTEVYSSSSAGVATISANRSSLTVNNPMVTDKSLIYITPREQTDDQVLYLLRQVPNTSFTVGLQQAPKTALPFNWLIVN